MSELFRRAFKLAIGSIVIDGTAVDYFPLDIAFTVAKSVKKEPNTIELQVFNLSADHRSEIESSRDVAVDLHAGYAGNMELIFSGDLRVSSTRKVSKSKKSKTKLATKREALETITEISADDGGRAYRDARIAASYPPGVTVSALISACISAMSIGSGNLRDYATSSTITGIGATYPTGTVLYGKARDELDRIIRSAGLRWSIQNGNLQILSGNNPIQETAVLLNYETGLIGSPEKASDGTITARSLLIPELMPGRKVVLESKTGRDQCIIKRVVFSGDSAGNDWYASLEMRTY